MSATNNQQDLIQAQLPASAFAGNPLTADLVATDYAIVDPNITGQWQLATGFYSNGTITGMAAPLYMNGQSLRVGTNGDVVLYDQFSDPLIGTNVSDSSSVLVLDGDNYRAIVNSPLLLRQGFTDGSGTISGDGSGDFTMGSSFATFVPPGNSLDVNGLFEGSGGLIAPDGSGGLTFNDAGLNITRLVTSDSSGNKAYLQLVGFNGDASIFNTIGAGLRAGGDGSVYLNGSDVVLNGASLNNPLGLVTQNGSGNIAATSFTGNGSGLTGYATALQVSQANSPSATIVDGNLVTISGGAFTDSGVAASSLKPTYAGTKTATGTATTTFTVTIGHTMANTNYTATTEGLNALSAAVHYVTNKTTTTFDVVYLAGLTGAVAFDWAVTPYN